MFQLDLGNSGSDVNVFLQWSARGTLDGAIRARKFYIREGAAKSEMDAVETTGIVLDLDSLKTGWQKSEGISGVAPDWKWNPSVNQMMAKPGDDYKKGFSIKVSMPGGKVAMWEQAGAAAWSTLADLAPALAQQPDKGKMPVVKLKEVKELKFQKGSTAYAVLEIAKWVDKPDSLKEGAAAGIAIDEPAPVQAQQSAPAQADDDVEF